MYARKTRYYAVCGVYTQSNEYLYLYAGNICCMLLRKHKTRRFRSVGVILMEWGKCVRVAKWNAPQTSGIMVNEYFEGIEKARIHIKCNHHRRLFASSWGSFCLKLGQNIFFSLQLWADVNIFGVIMAALEVSNHCDKMSDLF